LGRYLATGTLIHDLARDNVHGGETLMPKKKAKKKKKH
jgi:hypothetical protein